MATMFDIVRKMLELGMAVPPGSAAQLERTSIFKTGYIIKVQPNGMILVSTDEGAVSAVPVTDETLSTGQKIFLLKAENNTNIILGSSRQ